MISCIILSAGLSSRFGSPKALAPIYKTTIINYLLQKMSQTKIGELIVVLGADKEKIEACLLNHSKIQIVYNNDYYLGQLSSIKSGLKASSQHAAGIMILPVDCPFIKLATIDQIIDHFLAKKPSVLIPTFGGRKGHPPVIHAQLRQHILDLADSQNLANVLKDPHFQALHLELIDPGILQTFNTPEELSKILSENPVN